MSQEDPYTYTPIRLNDLEFYGTDLYADFLKATGIDSKQKILDYNATVVDRNTDKKVIRLEADFDAPTTIYMKCFNEARASHLLKRLTSQRLKSLGRIEVESLRLLNSKGYNTAELLFWGRTKAVAGVDGAFSFCGLKDLSGHRELALIKNDDPAIGLARTAASRVFLRLLDDNLQWPDSHPEHFFIKEADNTVALIDLHGLTQNGAITNKVLKKMVKRFLRLHEEEDKESFKALAEEVIKDTALKRRVIELADVKSPAP